MATRLLTLGLLIWLASAAAHAVTHQVQVITRSARLGARTR